MRAPKCILDPSNVLKIHAFFLVWDRCSKKLSLNPKPFFTLDARKTDLFFGLAIVSPSPWITFSYRPCYHNQFWELGAHACCTALYQAQRRFCVQDAARAGFISVVGMTCCYVWLTIEVCAAPPSFYWLSQLSREVMSTSLTHPSSIRRHQLGAANGTFHGTSSLN